MSIYNVILFSKNPSPSESKKYREERNELVKSLSNMKASQTRSHSKRSRNDEEMHSVYFFYDNESMSVLVKQLEANDVIRIHGHGNPMILGANYSEIDLSAYSLAKMISDYKIPRDKSLTIDILSCHSAVSFSRTVVSSCTQTPSVKIDYNFAQDVSTALGLLGYNNLTVSGYTGYIAEKNKCDKYSVQSFGVYDIDVAKTLNEKLQGKHMLPPHNPSEIIQGDYEKCRRAYFRGTLLNLPEGYIELHCSKYRDIIWNSKRAHHLQSDSEREDFYSQIAAENTRRLLGVRLVEEQLVRDYNGEEKFLFFKSSKTAQEAFDESPAFKQSN